MSEGQSIPCTHGWRPIKSAPRDGTHILIYNGLDNGCTTSIQSNIAVARFSHEWHRKNGSITTAWEYGTYDSATSKYGKGSYVIDATHWQPLPKPPQEAI